VWTLGFAKPSRREEETVKIRVFLLVNKENHDQIFAVGLDFDNGQEAMTYRKGSDGFPIFGTHDSAESAHRMFGFAGDMDLVWPGFRQEWGDEGDEDEDGDGGGGDGPDDLPDSEPDLAAQRSEPTTEPGFAATPPGLDSELDLGATLAELSQV
jgi:hypothetical protein